MLTLATTFLLLSTTVKTGPQPHSDSLPDAPSAQLQQQQAPNASPPPNHPRPSPQWLKVEALQPGDSIAVLEPVRHFPTPCRFDDVTDYSLTCTIYPLHTSPRRAVYPISNIEAIYTDEWIDGPTPTPLIIGAAIGGFLGGIVCNQGDAGTIAACVALGAALGAGIALTPSPYPTRPHPHLRRQLIYHAP